MAADQLTFPQGHNQRSISPSLNYRFVWVLPAPSSIRSLQAHLPVALPITSYSAQRKARSQRKKCIANGAKVVLTLTLSCSLPDSTKQVYFDCSNTVQRNVAIPDIIRVVRVVSCKYCRPRLICRRSLRQSSSSERPNCCKFDRFEGKKTKKRRQPTRHVERIPLFHEDIEVPRPGVRDLFTSWQSL